MTTSPGDATPRDEEADPGPLSPPMVRALTIAVIVMGIMIVLGVLAVIARIIYLASASPKSVAQGTALKADADLALPAGAAVRTISVGGNRLAIQYDSPTGPGIAIVDLETGRTISRLRLVPEAPR